MCKEVVITIKFKEGLTKDEVVKVKLELIRDVDFLINTALNRLWADKCTSYNVAEKEE